MHAELDNVVFFEVDYGICCILSDGPSEYKKKHRGSQGLQASDFVVLFGFLLKYCVKILLLVFLLNCTFVW